MSNNEVETEFGGIKENGLSTEESKALSPFGATLLFSFIFFVGFFAVLSFIGLIFGYGWWVPIAAIILTVITVLSSINSKMPEFGNKELNNKLDEKTEILNNIPDFKRTERFNSFDGNEVIAIDENNMKICLLKASTPKIYHYRDILESVVVEDGITITKTSRGSQIGGALIGGVLTGGVGAIIGGLSGKKTSTEQVKRIDLKIVVNDTRNPIFTFNFMDCLSNRSGISYKGGVPKDNDIYKRAYHRASKWHSLISVLIKQADDADKKEEQKNQYASQSEREHNEINHVKSIASNSVSVADELLKLSELEKQGIITKEEFDKQKEKVLSK